MQFSLNRPLGGFGILFATFPGDFCEFKATKRCVNGI